MFDEAFGFELISDSSHSYFFRLSPLGSLQRHIDTRGKKEKAEEGGNDQPGALRRLKEGPAGSVISRRWSFRGPANRLMRLFSFALGRQVNADALRPAVRLWSEKRDW